MSQAESLSRARQLLAALGAAKDRRGIAAFFSEDVVFEVAGDSAALPWIGRKSTGREAIVQFFNGLRTLTESIKFDVQDVLASDARAATRIKAAGKVIESPFAIILTVSAGQIARHQMLEDSFAVSNAAKD